MSAIHVIFNSLAMVFIELLTLQAPVPQARSINPILPITEDFSVRLAFSILTFESLFVYSCHGMSMWLFIRSSPISFIYNTHSINIYSIFNSMNSIVKKKKKSIS